MKKKVLIVDADPNIVISLEFLMQKDGYEVALATDGEEAMTKVQTFHPDLVLMDAIMPKKTGYEICESLRADPAYGNTRILMLSAKGRESEVAKGLALGADLYMTKPFSSRELAGNVKSLLGLS